MLDNMALHQSEQHSLRILAIKWQSQPTQGMCLLVLHLNNLHVAFTVLHRCGIHRAMLTWHKVLSCTNRWP